MRELQKQFDLRVIGVLIILFLTAFAFYKSNAAKTKIDEWVRAKKNTALSCAADGSAGINYYDKTHKNGAFNNNHKSNTDQQPAKNGNGCSHAMGGYMLCEIAGTKRRSLKAPGC